jgi:hypothetical protein
MHPAAGRQFIGFARPADHRFVYLFCPSGKPLC